MKRLSPKRYAAILAGLAEDLPVETACKAFAEFLRDRNDLKQINRIIEAFESEWRVSHHQTLVSVESSRALSAAERKSIETAVAGESKQTVEIDETVTPALLAGLRVRVGDTVVDATLSGHLESLRRSLVKVGSV